MTVARVAISSHPYLDQLQAESRARRLRLGIDQPKAPRHASLPPQLKATGKASPSGARSDLITYLQSVFGKDLPPICDARVPVRLQPMPVDAIDAKPLSPNACLVARTAARMYGSRGVAFFKGLAYIDLADEHGDRRLERFIASKATVSVIRDFDAGKPISLGFAVVLYPPTKPHRLASKRRTARKRHRTPTGRATAELSNANQAVRNATAHAERIAEALRKAKAAGDTRQKSKWTRRAEAAAARLEAVHERLGKAQRRADETRAAKPRRRPMDLTTRSGCLGRYCFAPARNEAAMCEPPQHAAALP